MDGNKFEVSAKASGGDQTQTTATYKQIPEADLEERAMSRPKNLVKPETNNSKEVDGADEKMLPEDEKKMSPNSNIGPADVKFTLNEKQNGDAKLDIGELKTSYGMTKEELLKYADDPFWVRLRWFLFVLFWVLWIAMLTGAVLIIYFAPKCEAPATRTWWERGPLTEGTVDFQIGDLKELEEKGVQGIVAPWPEDTYAALNKSDDFIGLLKRVNQTNLNLIVELRPTHSTVWFDQSENGDEIYNDYYIWRKPRGINSTGHPELPNNWLDITNKSSWAYSDKRKEFYYAPLGRPHLNFRNPNVIDEFSAVIKNFLQNGVKGVSLSGTPYLLVDANYENEEANKFVVGHYLSDYNFFLHTKTMYLEDIAPVIKKWRSVVKTNTDNGLFMLSEDSVKLEPYTINNTLYIDLPRISNVFNTSNITASKIIKALNSSNLLNVTWPLWKHNNEELPSDVLDIVTFLLPGTVMIDRNRTIPKELLEVRQSQSVMYGLTQYYEVANKTVFAFIRVASGNPGVLVGLNPTNSTVTVDFHKEIPAVSEEVIVKYFNKRYDEPNIIVKKKISADLVPISARSAIVLSYVPKSEE